jgi:hypothetical protein
MNAIPSLLEDDQTLENEMRDFPTDPIRQHNRMIAAFCDDLWDGWAKGTSGTPKMDRVLEIARQINSNREDCHHG